MNMQNLSDLKAKAFAEAEKVCPGVFANKDPVLCGRAALVIATWWDSYYQKACATMYTRAVESMDRYVDFVVDKFLGK